MSDTPRLKLFLWLWITAVLAFVCGRIWAEVIWP